MIKTDGRFTWKVKITKERYGSSNSPVIGIGGGENGEVEIKEIKTLCMCMWHGEGEILLGND